MILRVAEDGTSIAVDREGADYLIEGLAGLRDSEPGTIARTPFLTATGAGIFQLVRAEDQRA